MAKKIVVLLDELSLQAHEDGKVVMEFAMVPGDGNHPTPTGCFTIRSKHKVYRSKKYDAQMNYAMFFKDTGEAIHQYHGVIPVWLLKSMRKTSDWIGSHGCARLDEDNAKNLFEWTPVGTLVVVGNKTSLPSCPVTPKPKKKKK